MVLTGEEHRGKVGETQCPSNIIIISPSETCDLTEKLEASDCSRLCHENNSFNVLVVSWHHLADSQLIDFKTKLKEYGILSVFTSRGQLLRLQGGGGPTSPPNCIAKQVPSYSSIEGRVCFLD